MERPRNLSLVNNGPLVRLCNTGPVLGQHLQWDGPEIPAFTAPRICNTGPVLGRLLKWNGPEIPAW